MTQQWRLRVHGTPRKRPDIEQLARAVFLLAEELQRQEANDARHQSKPAGSEPIDDEGATNP